MGTHPIFESDFDCLTEMLRLALFRNALRTRSLQYSQSRSITDSTRRWAEAKPKTGTEEIEEEKEKSIFDNDPKTAAKEINEKFTSEQKAKGIMEESSSLIWGIFICIFALFVMQKRAMTGGEDTRATRPG